MRIDQNPKHWKLLIFYYNPDDPRTFVAKRSGLGHTLNFAKPIVFWVTIALTLAIVTIAAINNNVNPVR